MSSKAPYHFQTKALNAGLQQTDNGISPALIMSVNHTFSPHAGAFSAAALGDLTHAPYLYAGWSNPTVRQLEQRISALEQSEDTFACASGMAALSGCFLSLLQKGDHLIISDVCYAAVSEFAHRHLTRLGIEVSAVNVADIEELKRALRPNTRLVHCEVPANPMLRLCDVAAIAHLLHSKAILLSVDATLASPAVIQPLTLGADLVIHSMTKFINGHGDAMGGCVSAKQALISNIRSYAGAYLGCTLSAANAWLIMRGIDTLFARMQSACASALTIARWLETQPRVRKVNYPGLASHPQHTLACTQMPMFGAIISFQVDDAELISQRFASEATLFYYAYSLGHQRSLAVLLQTEELLQSLSLNAAQQKACIADCGTALLRLSIGLEHVDDLLAELDYLLRI